MVKSLRDELNKKSGVERFQGKRVTFLSTASGPMKLYLTILAFLLNACGPSLEADKQGADVPRDDKIRFITPWNGEDGMSLYARIDGTNHLIQDEVRNVTMIPAGRFTGWGIPADAAIAAIFLETIDTKLDYQGTYVIRGEDGPKIYRGFYVPGLGNYVQWEEVPLRFD